MRTVIKDQVLEWCSVLSGVPQASVLSQVMLVVYVNDKIKGVNSYMSNNNESIRR